MVATKTCTRCKTIKPINRFVRDANRGDGFYPKCKDCRHEYYLENSSHIRAKMREYNRHHRPRISEWHKEYASRRFFYKTASNLRLRSKGEAATYKEIARLWKAQRGICPISSRRLTQDSAQLDHIIPSIRGGSSTIENLRWVHRDVNYAKRDLLDAEFLALCQEITTANSRKQRT